MPDITLASIDRINLRLIDVQSNNCGRRASELNRQWQSDITQSNNTNIHDEPTKSCSLSSFKASIIALALILKPTRFSSRKMLPHISNSIPSLEGALARRRYPFRTNAYYFEFG